jgi:hypothetical protein
VEIKNGALHHNGNRYPLADYDEVRIWQDHARHSEQHCWLMAGGQAKERIPVPGGHPEASALQDLCRPYLLNKALLARTYEAEPEEEPQAQAEPESETPEESAPAEAPEETQPEETPEGEESDDAATVQADPVQSEPA